jgi:hypothetical protein
VIHLFRYEEHFPDIVFFLIEMNKKILRKLIEEYYLPDILSQRFLTLFLWRKKRFCTNEDIFALR